MQRVRIQCLLFFLVTDEDYLIPSQFNFISIPSQDCVTVDLLSDSSLEGCHSFTVSLNVPEYPTINTTGLTDILIEDTNGRSCTQQHALLTHKCIDMDTHNHVDSVISKEL